MEVTDVGIVLTLGTEQAGKVTRFGTSVIKHLGTSTAKCSLLEQASQLPDVDASAAKCLGTVKCFPSEQASKMPDIGARKC